MFSPRNSLLSIVGSMIMAGFIFFPFTPIFAVSTGEVNISTSGFSAQKIVSINITDIASDSVNVDWEKINGYNGYVIHYGTQSSIKSGIYKYNSAIIDSTGTTLKNLIPNTTYYLIVKTFDKDANEILISEETKFTTLAIDTTITPNINSDKNSSIKGINNTKNKSVEKLNPINGQYNVTNNSIISDNTEINNHFGRNNLNQITSNTDKIEQLPKTGPASYIIIILSLVISFILIFFLRRWDLNLKK